MKRRNAIVALAAFSARPAIAADPPKIDELHPIGVEKLSRNLVDKEVTVHFPISEVHSIAQLRSSPGQAAIFGIRAEPQGRKRLGVWIRGELANVFDRLQMSVLQENQLRVGTTVQVTGKLSVHSMDDELFHIDVDHLTDFKVVPQPKSKGITKP